VLLINVAACSVMVYHVEMGSTMDMDSELDLLTAETSKWQVVTVAVSFYILYSPEVVDYLARFFVPRVLRTFINPCSKYSVCFGGL